jgi:hypothetical protein
MAHQRMYDDLNGAIKRELRGSLCQLPSLHKKPLGSFDHMIHTGKMVFISSPTIGCADELIQLCQRSVDFHRPLVHLPSNENEFFAYMNRIAAGTTIGLFVRRIADNRLIGVVNLNEPVMGALRSAYLGFYADCLLSKARPDDRRSRFVLDQSS